MKKILITILLLSSINLAKSADILISTPTVWSSNMTIPDNVRILPGGILTINNNAIITMSSGHFIEAKTSTPVGTNGGKLILENCTITGLLSSGAGNWTGIFIIGNKNYSQEDSRMARLKINGNVLIEGPSVGITNFDFVNDASALNTGGGIIQATGVTIQKTHFCVYIRHYQNFKLNNPAIKLNDQSYFKRSTFKRTTGGWYQTELVVLDEVEGVSFKSCDFTVDPLLPGITFQMTGILLMEAGANITRDCSPCISTIYNRFTNLKWGVRALNNGTLHRVTVKYSEFDQFLYGIVLDGANYPYLCLNNFYPNTSFITQKVGIALYSTKQYSIMDNKVTYPGISTSNQVFGISINNGGDLIEMVHNNTIKNCQYALKADGENRHGTNQTGLRYICNDLQNNTDPNAYDIIIDGGFSTTKRGIAKFQGEHATPYGVLAAGNDFSGTLVTGHSIVNNSHGFNYFGALINGNGTTGIVNIITSFIDTNTCVSKICEFPCISYDNDVPTFPVVSGGLITLLQTETDTALWNDILIEYEELLQSVINSYLGEPGDENAEQDYDTISLILQNAPIFTDPPSSITTNFNQKKKLLGYHVMKAGLLIQQKEYKKAIKLLKNDLIEFDLDNEKKMQINDLIDMIIIQKDLYEGGDWNVISKNHKSNIEYIANKKYEELATPFAKFILAKYDSTVFIPKLFATNVKENLKVNKNLTVFPNPATDIINISPNIVKYSIYDLTGKIMLEENSNKKNIIKIGKLAKGVYIVKLIDKNNNINSIKFTKQ